MKNLLLLLLCFIVACKNSTDPKVESENESTESSVPELTADHPSFAFTYPPDWEITDEEWIEEGVYYLSIEKKGLTSSGLIVITSFDQLNDLDEIIMMNVDQLYSNNFLKNLEVDPITEGQFNDINSRTSKFQFSAMNKEHEGVIHAFSGKGNTYMVLMQEAKEDNKANATGFLEIEKSFVPK